MFEYSSGYIESERAVSCFSSTSDNEVLLEVRDIIEEHHVHPNNNDAKCFP